MDSEEYYLSDFLIGKSDHTLVLFNHFINRFNTIGNVEVVPLKSMIGLDNGHKRIAYITQLGKNFIHVVFPFKQEYPDNLCFQKIAQVPGQQQFNHHFRMLNVEDVNEEVISFMKLAYLGEV
ncbi:hypothetical protein EWM62_00580 [Mucilaginibacter terrigena]|uniref:DUF5655 domain-containing protein n=1 Tax=Mucilaginibacter terrigena TaxID=2492395 RepID=A0A4Q5LR51_9SPHI|nr:DUF5655 domain-containing protein [Mucilaginibacter terrigena]RYU91971.1 hypothetical protein EWM62_00580 [Mucilaginibacter terrigena]